MPIRLFRRNFYSIRERSTMRSTFVLLVVASIGYVAGAFVHELLPPPNDPAAFARSIGAAEASSGDDAPAHLATMPGADKVRRSDAEWIEDPRECDLARGISTACIFMD